VEDASLGFRSVMTGGLPPHRIKLGTLEEVFRSLGLPSRSSRRAKRMNRRPSAKLMGSATACGALKDQTLLDTKLERLGGSTRELLDLIERISKAGAALFGLLGDPQFETSLLPRRGFSACLENFPCRRREPAGRRADPASN
jgi:hypothetical protein